MGACIGLSRVQRARWWVLAAFDARAASSARGTGPAPWFLGGGSMLLRSLGHAPGALPWKQRRIGAESASNPGEDGPADATTSSAPRRVVHAGSAHGVSGCTRLDASHAGRLAAAIA